jgi:hypothetical protein
MSLMARKLIMALTIVAMLSLLCDGMSAWAQLPPGAPIVPPPLPPLPTQPDLSLTRPPKMDELPRAHRQIMPRGSFHDRVLDCRQQAAAAGLNPGDRDTYTRSCVN